MNLETLPEVAKSVYTLCKKCDTDRYHKVIAHLDATSAKIQCEVCSSKRKFSIAKKVAKPRVKTARSEAERSKKALNHVSEYETLLAKHDTAPTEKYTIGGVFTVNQKIDHSKFGLGIVKSAFAEKIEVIFADEVKNLIHRRA